MSLSFSTFMFSTLYSASSSTFGILILSEQFDGFVQLHPWCILKDRQLCLHKYVKYYWVLSHYRLGKTNQDTRFDIGLELGCSAMEIYRMEWFWCRYGFTFKFYKYTFKQHQAKATKYFEVQATSMTSCHCKYTVQYNL